ncbi:macrophage mannose receptor 1-like [Crassostrea angulata]|uniref:macrophage mannose receptor 1-like n=1 Tax=Magallana angulata TaxID=2784310 RepID=UPI0022B08583|nr:macrophage mannose receptor 1-like [Crassostrea angulata]
MNFLIFILVCLICIAETKVQTDLCDISNYWTHYGSHCYKIYNTSLSWEDAANVCRFLDAELPIIDDDDIQESLVNLSKSVQAELWIGISLYRGNWVNPSYENVNHINQSWTLSDSSDPFGTNNRSCVVIREKDGILKWIFKDCKQRSYFACSKPEGTCPLGWIFHQRTCYRYIDTLQTSWNNSILYCQLMDSTLLEITDVDKQVFIHQLVQVQSPGIGNDDRLWLNLRKDAQDDWIWEGSWPTYTNWFNETDEFQFNCSYMDTSREGKWFTDIPCSSSANTICNFDVGSSNWEKNMLKAEVKENKTSSECGFGWVNDPLGDSCYLVKKELLVWSAAEDECIKQGAHLISLDSVHEQGYISGFLHSSKDDYLAFWIGANSRTDGEGFKWSNGAPFVFYNWFPEQPDGQEGGTEECVVMFSSNGKWSDVSCGQRHSFICEKNRSSKLKTTTVKPIENNGSSKACQDGWKIYNNQCILIERRKLSWIEASEFCRKQKGFLASVEDQNEQNFLYSQLPSNYCFNLHSNDTYCSELAAAGKCTADLLFMTKQCMAACGICDLVCHDVFESTTCQAWARTGGCEKNPTFMLRGCGKTCEGCESVLKGGFWLGLRDSKDQTFVWENGEDVSFSFWRRSEPQGYVPYKQGCTAMAYQDGMWFDQDCNTVMPGFICKSPMQYIGTTTVSPGCNETYISYESMCYKFAEENLSWNEAQANCESENGHLATVNSRYIQAFLSSQLFEKAGNYWIGYKETRANDSSTLWNSGHPIEFQFGDIVDSSSLHQTEACAAMTTTVPVGIWSFINCETKQKFICETLRDGYTTTIISPPTTPPLMCPDNWITIDNNCFKVFENSTWTNARAYCRGIGADLASIHSEAELNDLQSKIRKSGDMYWVGLNDREKEEYWVWSDGTPVVYAPWMDNRIVNLNANEHCVVFRYIDGSFDDLSCTNLHPFICKVPKGVEIQKHFQPIPIEKCADERFISFNGSCFAVNFMNTTYFEAQRLCHQKDAELTSIHNRRENIFLAEIGNGSLWIGLRDLQNDGFQWNDGTPFDFEVWNSVKYAQYVFGSPTGKRRCSVFNAGTWSPVNCGHRVNGFICKQREHGDSEPVPPALIIGGCPEQFKPSPYNNKCYKLVKETKTWFGAVDECLKRNSSLLSIKDQIEQDFVINLLEWSNQYLWIGLLMQSMTKDKGGEYLWESNNEVTYTNWKTGEPFIKYNCVEMQGYSDMMNVGTWKTNYCTAERGFICEAWKDLSIPVIESTVCPPHYVENNGRCYRFFQDIPLDWESADHFCTLDNGTLASISTIYRFGFIQALGRHVNLTTYWIGLRRSNTSDLYMWSNGLPYIFTNWNQSEPSQKPGEDCVLSHNNKWKDTSCKIRLPFLCEKIIENQPLPPPLKVNCTASAMALNGACYHFELEHAESWMDARNKCKQFDMDLVSIHSTIEIEHMVEFVIRNGLTRSFWIGLSRRKDLTDPIEKISFYWSDESDFDYANWNEEEPSDSLLSQTEECVEMFTNGTWNDASCDQIKGFVCMESGFSGIQTTIKVYDVASTTDDNTTWLKSFINNPKVVFAITGVVIGLLLIMVAVGSIAFFIKSRKFSSSYKEPISAGFENAVYFKDEENVFISEL